MTSTRPSTPMRLSRSVTNALQGAALLLTIGAASTTPITQARHVSKSQTWIQAHRRTTNGKVLLATLIPNDNRHPAGRLHDGVLTVALEARAGAWFPEGPGGKSLDVAAFAEAGRDLQNPGPLIRVPVGTLVRATVRNALHTPMTLYGFGATARGAGDSVILAPGESRELRFVATTPGTYYYAGKTSPGPLVDRLNDGSQLNGAIIVDPLGAVSPDRVFLLSWWFTLDSTSPSGLGHGTMTINGLSWPHTERLEMMQGDSARWRLVNFTGSDHPMHLHGFYFRMDAKGDGVRDTLYAPAEQRLAVTEIIFPLQTMMLAWSATRPGDWIFHCHFAGTCPSSCRSIRTAANWIRRQPCTTRQSARTTCTASRSTTATPTACPGGAATAAIFSPPSRPATR